MLPRAHIGAKELGVSLIDLDWPSYTSPKARRMPWFLQAALLVARAGYKILLHGSDGGTHVSGMIVLAAQALGIPVCTSLGSAEKAVAEHGIAYLPVAAMSSRIQRLLSLYGLFETRSSVNSMMPLLNPLGARALMMGVVRPAYRDLHRDAGKLLGCKHLTILGSRRDAAEATPFRSSTLLRLIDGVAEDVFVPAVPEPKAYPLAGMTSLEYWSSIWTGAARDERATQIIGATAATALLTLTGGNAGRYEAYLERARELWETRQKDCFRH
jgi:anthranilate phosphoribosyltransferase